MCSELQTKIVFFRCDFTVKHVTVSRSGERRGETAPDYKRQHWVGSLLFPLGVVGRGGPAGNKVLRMARAAPHASRSDETRVSKRRAPSTCVSYSPHAYASVVFGLFVRARARSSCVGLTSWPGRQFIGALRARSGKGSLASGKAGFP